MKINKNFENIQNNIFGYACFKQQYESVVQAVQNMMGKKQSQLIISSSPQR